MQISGLNALYQATAARRATSAQTADSKSSTGTAAGSGVGVSSYDFTKMSRSEMKQVSQRLFESGQIDLDQLGFLQLSGPMGKVGANGEFVPFTDSERAQIDSQPVNYLKLADDAIKGIESRGEASNPKSGYQTWQSVRSLLHSWQGQTSAVNITV